jgi:hypothetical protein
MIPKDQEGGGDIFKRSRAAQHPLRLFNADGTVLQRIRGTPKAHGISSPRISGSTAHLQARVTAPRLLLFFSAVKAILCPRAKPIFGGHMLKKMLTLLCALVFSMSMLALAQDKKEGQDKPASMEKAAKKARWEGIVIRSDKDKSMLTVRQRGSNVEKSVMYDTSTEWTSQEHGSKKVNKIDAGDLKDSDRVICLGTWDKDGVLHATMISKRLTN